MIYYISNNTMDLVKNDNAKQYIDYSRSTFGSFVENISDQI